MCMSPHEMTSGHLEELIQRSEDFLASEEGRGAADWIRRTHEGRIENMRKVLKERAENGTY